MNVIDEITLKDCPFCGGIPELSHCGGGITTRFAFIKCTKCGVTTAEVAVSASYAADAVVADAWNRRTEGAEND